MGYGLCLLTYYLLKVLCNHITKVHINLVDTKTKLSLMSSLDFPNTHITRVDTLVSRYVHAATAEEAEP